MSDEVTPASVPYDPIGAIVLARMHELGKNVSQLAGEAQVPRVPLSFWLNGHRGLRSDRVARILTALRLAIVDAASHDATPPTDGEQGKALIEAFVEQKSSIIEKSFTSEQDMEDAWREFCEQLQMDAGPRGVVGRLLRESFGASVRYRITAGPKGKAVKGYHGITLRAAEPTKQRRKRKR